MNELERFYFRSHWSGGHFNVHR